MKTAVVSLSKARYSLFLPHQQISFALYLELNGETTVFSRYSNVYIRCSYHYENDFGSDFLSVSVCLEVDCSVVILKWCR